MPYCDGNLEAIAFKQVFIYHENKCKLNFNEYIYCIIKFSSIAIFQLIKSYNNSCIIHLSYYDRKPVLFNVLEYAYNWKV